MFEHVYPQQRSQGVRWFVSFYLQLKATEAAKRKQIFLLDEPGANLHSKAQGDVLRLINQLSREITILYSTHSPHMIEYDKLYRVQAVRDKKVAWKDFDDETRAAIGATKLSITSLLKPNVDG